MFERRVVITGMGVVAPNGNDLQTFWNNLIHGVSGIDTIAMFDASSYDTRIAGEVRGYDPLPYFKGGVRELRRADRYTQLTMGAAKMAMADCGVDLEKTDLNRFGCMLGSGVGGLRTLEIQHSILENKGPDRVSPFMIPMMISNMASGLVSMEFGLCGPNMCHVTACATANNAIGEAWRTIKFGDADIFLAGGSEASVNTLCISGFGSMKALSKRNDEPTKASRPWDTERDGFVASEGAGVLVVEELEHAKRRGARIYCELAGYGTSADAYHMTSPHPEGLGAARCMEMALKHARVRPEEVDYINAHGTSTGLGDVCETKAIKKVFGQHAMPGGVIVSSTKSMTGHTLGAAGAIEMAACAMAIQTGLVPPTINLDQPDEGCDLDYVPHKTREAKVRVALNNSFGFGGHNATLIAKEFVD